MEWFEGNILNAVEISKSRNAVFVVYVEGTDPASAKMTEVINSPQICTSLKSDHFVAVKLSSDSASYTQFTEIYKVVPVPSLFFIGHNGRPIEIVHGSEDFSVQELERRIGSVLKQAGVEIAKKPSEEDVGSVQHSVPPVSFAVEADYVDLTQEEPDGEIYGSHMHIDSHKDDKSEFSDEDEDDEDQEEMDRMQQELRVEETTKLKELEEQKKIIMEHEREKSDERAVRQRILQQIESDKAERAEWADLFNLNNVATPKPPVNVVSSNYETTRIQFKLPDGRSEVYSFQSSDTLLTIRNHVRNSYTTPLNINNFKLVKHYPKRELTEEEDLCTLVSLDLVPSCVILVLAATSAYRIFNPIEVGVPATVHFSVFGVLHNIIVSPFYMIFSLVRGLWSITRTAPTNNEPVVTNNASTESRNGQNTMHRLRSTETDDDNNTWNGNSTQQM